MNKEMAIGFKEQFEKMRIDDLLEVQMVVQGVILIKFNELKKELMEIIDLD